MAAVSKRDLGSMMTVDDAARAMGVSRTTLYRLMRDAEINFVQVRGRRRIPERAVVDYLARNGHDAYSPRPRKP